MTERQAVIIGAGPAGLTAAYELLKRTDIHPVVLEKSQYMGGISRTVNYKGNRIDIGGHRFFSKSDRVMEWWLDILPMQAITSASQQIAYQGKRREVQAGSAPPDPEKAEEVMLVRHRKSRIYFLRKFFDYPITLSKDTLAKLGITRTLAIGFSYLRSALLPIRDERNLEQFFINRFGRKLYETFFKSYTEKVWGVSCQEISAEWGAQRVKGLSIWKTITHIVRRALASKADIAQKNVETSLIENFLYPKYGPGQMWETVARRVCSLGGEILTGWQVCRLITEGERIVALEARQESSGEVRRFSGDFFFSTMPVKDLVAALEPPAPAAVREISDNLIYRDFITVGLLCRKLRVWEQNGNGKIRIRDNWIYIQEPDVQVGRMQVFNNWSPYMVRDDSQTWIGLEYFCYQTDPLWRMSDEEMVRLAVAELEKINIVDAADVLDSTVIRMEKTYPAYFGAYSRFDEIRRFTDAFENLFLVGRNGMHKYNNQDHSMLAAMVAVDNIEAGVKTKDNLWAVNTEQEYHEETSEGAAELAEAYCQRQSS